MRSRQNDPEFVALTFWWVGVLGFVTAGYATAVLAILSFYGEGVAAIAVGFALARVMAREVGRRYPRQATNSRQRRRATQAYWALAFGGLPVFGASWLIGSFTDAAGLPILITGAVIGTCMNALALSIAFRAGIQDFAYSQTPD